MKIVIDIDEKDYEFIKSVNSIMKNSDTFQRIATDLFRATQEGTSLPKGHGDLIDRDVALADFDERCLSWECSVLKYIPTVIPADEVD